MSAPRGTQPVLGRRHGDGVRRGGRNDGLSLSRAGTECRGAFVPRPCHSFVITQRLTPVTAVPKL
ncbi:hypothetical protein SGLAM104S_06212 [Streptomyces glaucescens]